jgi:UDP-2,3-diacylglucosamine pyrophosphatase LpxH
MSWPVWLLRHSGDERYRRRISGGLTRAARRAERREPDRCPIDDLRAIIFSDHHRGRGDLADDFARCEGAYRAALGWYEERGYRLWLLGDVEELWENDPAAVIEHYTSTLDAEARFGTQRLWRFYGNHDMAWRRPDQVARLLRPLPAGVEVVEARRVLLTDRGRDVGALFLLHGHQGTIDSGNLVVVPFSRLVVRLVWASLQRSRGFATTSPATDARLRSKHDGAMFAWAAAPERHRDLPTVLIAGHTHHPVFRTSLPPDPHAEEARRLGALEEARRADPVDAAAVARARAELELQRARAERRDEHTPVIIDPPCYFNAGCCSFGDGDVTGLEISDGAVSLVRWLSNDGSAQPYTLAGPLALRDVFAAIRRAGTH